MMKNPDDQYSQAGPAPNRRYAGEDRGDHLMWEKRKDPRPWRISLLLIVGYLILLVPYVIAVNSGESGIVKDVRAIEAASLPSDIQDLLVNKNTPYYMVLIEDPIHSEKNANGQISKERKLVFSADPVQVNEFVRVDNTLTNFHSPPTIVPISDQTYDTIIIGDAGKVAFGVVVEVMNNLGLAPLLFVSQIIYLIGGLLLVMTLSYLLGRIPALWNIPAIVTCYSFQFFLAGRIASMNHIETDLPVLFFGLLFLPALVLAIWVRKAEGTREGSRFISGLYQMNMELYRGISGRLREILGIR